MIKEIWYAIMRNEDDNDWGEGTYNLDEAKKKTEVEYGHNGWIAVINLGDGHDPICIHTLHRDGAGDWRDEEGRYW